MQDRCVQIFDPRVYLDVHYSHLREPQDECRLFETILVKLHDFLAKVPNGDSVLNFGAGPTIHGVISASAKFKNIIFAEYTEANRIELKKWIANSKDKFDWTRYFKYVAVLEGQSESDWGVLEQRVRAAVRDVVHCDATMDPILDYQNPAFDSIIITLCLEEACPTFEVLKATIAKLAAILKPGGHLIIFSMIGETYYTVGEQVIKVTPHTEKQMKEAISGAGLSLKEQCQYVRHPEEDTGDDYTMMLGLLAQK